MEVIAKIMINILLNAKIIIEPKKYILSSFFSSKTKRKLFFNEYIIVFIDVANEAYPIPSQVILDTTCSVRNLFQLLNGTNRSRPNDFVRNKIYKENPNSWQCTHQIFITFCIQGMRKKEREVPSYMSQCLFNK